MENNEVFHLNNKTSHMKVSTLVLGALLSYTLNSQAQNAPKETGNPKTAQNPTEKKEIKGKGKAKAKTNPLDSTLNAKKIKGERDPDYCPACGMG
jgi:hypothetical protein